MVGSAFGERSSGNHGILPRCHMNSDSLTRQSSSPTESSPLGSSDRENSIPIKHGNYGMSEGNKSSTGFKGLQTPINLFEDECIFCHSFRTSQFHGPMVHYRKGKLVSNDMDSTSDLIYVHKKCMEWAPRVFYRGDTIVNLEMEISRASKLKCTRCMLPGAALGCYYQHCKRSYHVPCALMTLDCRWDVDNGSVLCPEHATKALPCDEISSPRKESGNFPQSQFSIKERKSTDCEREDHQLDQHNTSGSSLPQGQSLAKQGISAAHKREIDQFNTSCSSSFPQGQYLDKGVFNDGQKEEKQIDHLYTEKKCPSDMWVLLGTALSPSEKNNLQDFASWTNATVVNAWTENVTHVIVGKSAGSKWSKSYEVLMALLFGKWVVTTDWIVDSFAKLIPCPESSYELGFGHDSHTSIGGHKKGKFQASGGAQKLFTGLYFYLSTYIHPIDREQMQNLIAAAGGQTVERDLREEVGNVPAKPYIIYYSSAPREYNPNLLDDLRKEMEELADYVKYGAQVICHEEVFDAIAACDADILRRKDH
ncbi:hypothetical protein GUJ93_ZPchr0005g15745 [Zizania palustris]|uniref:Uncharacterized protein n=2 Tax=Zizania palustris TaxID=103762 RepID=A0A8J5SGN0_ZIZPA|nr:hypothetical protein GUJ93_ZPchr0005g15745 [Zizania palustris]KAG8068264.1 hypothetical protein GUJ93_ZPchr0005g15745 [Zizania palustris]